MYSLLSLSKVLPLLLITITITIIMPLYSSSNSASVTEFLLSATVVFKQKAITRRNLEAQILKNNFKQHKLANFSILFRRSTTNLALP